MINLMLNSPVCLFVILQTELAYLCDVKKKFVIDAYSVGHSKESLVTELQYLFLHPSLFPSRIKCQTVCPHQILEGSSHKLSKSSHALSRFNEGYLLLMAGLVFSLHHVDFFNRALFSILVASIFSY